MPLTYNDFIWYLYEIENITEHDFRALPFWEQESLIDRWEVYENE